MHSKLILYGANDMGITANGETDIWARPSGRRNHSEVTAMYFCLMNYVLTLKTYFALRFVIRQEIVYYFSLEITNISIRTEMRRKSTSEPGHHTNVQINTSFF